MLFNIKYLILWIYLSQVLRVLHSVEMFLVIRVLEPAIRELVP